MKIALTFVLILFCVMLQANTSHEEVESSINNPALVISTRITAPANRSSFLVGNSISINASASDPNFAITKVEFYQGAVLLGEDNASPYRYQLTIDGNFNNSNGVLEMELGGTTPQTEYDLLKVSGTSQLSGTLKVNFINDYLPDENQDFDIISSDGGIEGMFNEVIWSADYQGDVVNNINTLTVSSLSVLPVALLDFTAQTQGQNVELQWRTASEQNNRGFYIERSRDGLRWKSLGFVSGQGNADAVNTYRFVDKSALLGVNYYRLKQVDVDQGFAYSKVVSAEVQGKAIPQAYPNPTTGELEIKGWTGTPLQVKVMNALGETLQQISLTEGQGLNLHNQPAGLYFLEWQSQGQAFIQKVLKI